MGRPIESAPDRRTVLSALGVYAERPALVMVALGFSGSLPYFLIFDTLSAWFRAAGLSLEVIGFFSLVTLVSSFKFLWAPFIDRARVPRTPRLAGAPPLVDARVSGRDHARALARGPVRSVAQPRNDCRLCRPRRLLLSHAGHRHRRLAHRGGGDVQAGRHGRRVSVGLPRGNDRRGRGTAAPGPGVRLELLLRSDGGADGGGRSRGAGGAARRATRHPSDSDRRPSAGACT